MTRVIILTVFLLACGDNKPDAASPSPAMSGSSAPSAPSAAGGEGSECGDDVAIQKKCAAGLVCKPKPGAPVSEHTPGICSKP